MSIWLPPAVSRELVDMRHRHTTEVMDQARRDATLDYWTRELKRIDDRLELIRAKDDSELLKPGFYYVLRHNAGAPPSLIAVETETGAFREPDSGIFDLLRRNDLWNREARQDRERMRRDVEDAKRKRRETERQARLEEIKERVKALTETSVSMSQTDRPWTQTAKARRG